MTTAGSVRRARALRLAPGARPGRPPEPTRSRSVRAARSIGDRVAGVLGWWPEAMGAGAARFGLAWWARPGHREVDHAVLLEGVARSLRGGQSLSAALVEAAQTGGAGLAGDQLARSARLAAAGLGTVAVVEDWVRREPEPARVLAGAALALGAEVGGAHARSLDAAAASLRDRAGLEGEVRALTSQARASAAVMVLAPLGFAAFTAITEPRVAHVVAGTALGWGCVGAGLVLDLVGAWWMARLAGRLT